MLASTSLTAIDRRTTSTDTPSSLEASTSDAAANAAAAENRPTTDMNSQPARSRSAPWPWQESCSPAVGNGSTFEALRLPAASGGLLNKAVASRSSSQEQEPSTGQATKRKVSSYFGGQPKRHRSAEAEELPVRISPHGLLGGLVSKLNPQKPCGDGDSSADDGISVDLDADEEADCSHVPQRDVPVATDDDSEDAQQNDVEPHPEAIAGLEHVQPFASIANHVVGKVKAASLKKFGMAAADMQKSTAHRRERNVLQPFAPPRRCSVSQDRPQHAAGCTQGGSCIAPALQKFVCSTGSSDRPQTEH